MERIRDTDLILNADGSVYHLGLLPAQLADTILAVGDPDRVAKVSQHFDTVEFKVQRREFVTHTGTYRGKRISVISTGIGPDNVEIFFHEVDALVNIDLKKKEPRPELKSLKIIRVGTSGTVQPDIPIESMLLSDRAVGFDNLMAYYDLPQSSDENELGLALQRHATLSFQPYVVSGSSTLRAQVGKGMVTGHTVTCPGFYAPQGRRVRVPIRYPKLLNDLGSFRSGDFRIANFEMETAAYFALGRLRGDQTASVSAILANRATGDFSTRATTVIEALILQVLNSL